MQSSKVPLAERMRPKKLTDFIGQDQIIGHGSPLRSMVENGKILSMILWGPPGVGKTTLAQLFSEKLNTPFLTLNAVQSGVKEIREAIEYAKYHPGTIVFIDEIHRFNKSQQDSLLNAVENGTIVLIGATTENPSFEINSALLSRCQIYILQSLNNENLKSILDHAIVNDEFLFKNEITIQEYDALYENSAGDARRILNILELCAEWMIVNKFEPKSINNKIVAEVTKTNPVRYDKTGDQHYDIISAFIKSIRGSDPNGALYWLARMIHGGEDVKFIARRMVILASEDIGNANPNALLLANCCFDAVNKIGMPESRIILAQTATYLATSLKSNASYIGIDAALDLVRKNPNRPVPLHLRNAPTGLMKKLNYGKEYKYSHDFEGIESQQEYLPEGIENTILYQPNEIGKEKEILQYLKYYWKGKYNY